MLAAAGIDHVTDAEDKARRGDWLRLAPVGNGRRPGGSTWQSLARGTPVEVDYLNGEIVLLGRLHGVPAPVNEMLQRAAHEAAAAGAAPGSIPAPTCWPGSDARVDSASADRHSTIRRSISWPLASSKSSNSMCRPRSAGAARPAG